MIPQPQPLPIHGSHIASSREDNRTAGASVPAPALYTETLGITTFTGSHVDMGGLAPRLLSARR